MDRSVISRGKSVKEAVGTALDLLHATQDEVSIEILDNESKGILGLGAKPAIVRVSVRENGQAARAAEWDVLAAAVQAIAEQPEPDAQPDARPDAALAAPARDERPEPALAGKAWVKDGRICCMDGPDSYPLLAPAAGCSLLKNGESFARTIVISEKDSVLAALEDEEVSPSWELSVSPDQMEVVLQVAPGFLLMRRLQDTGPSAFVQLKVAETRHIVHVPVDEVLEEVVRLEIVHGIDPDEIVRACGSDEAGSFIVARGTPMVPGQNGSFAPSQDMAVKKSFRKRADGTIDYRDHQVFPAVEPGHILGVVLPPVPGYPGITVTGEPVAPPEVFPLNVKEGHGVAFVENGRKLVALAAGLPEVKELGRQAVVSIRPKLIVSGDVDLQSGNVSYKGDVEIGGSVQDAMQVDARGNVLVRHNVNMAKVSAGRSVIVHNNIITSEIAAGKRKLILTDVARQAEEVMRMMMLMANAIQQLSNVSAFKASSFTQTGLGSLIKILCEGKFKSFAPTAKALIHTIKNGAHVLDQEWIEFADRVLKGFIFSHSTRFETIDDISAMIVMADELIRSARSAPDELDGFIQAGFIQGSEICSSGDISVIGKGVYNSRLHAGGSVTITGSVRGGEIRAGGNVTIGEVGTRGGITSRIEVPEHACIRIGQASADTFVLVGNQPHQFTASTAGVYARLNEHRRLIIS